MHNDNFIGNCEITLNTSVHFEVPSMDKDLLVFYELHHMLIYGLIK